MLNSWPVGTAPEGSYSADLPHADPQSFAASHCTTRGVSAVRGGRDYEEEHKYECASGTCCARGADAEQAEKKTWERRRAAPHTLEAPQPAPRRNVRATNCAQQSASLRRRRQSGASCDRGQV
jgi:hypothetical protein